MTTRLHFLPVTLPEHPTMRGLTPGSATTPHWPEAMCTTWTLLARRCTPNPSSMRCTQTSVVDFIPTRIGARAIWWCLSLASQAQRTGRHDADSAIALAQDLKPEEYTLSRCRNVLQASQYPCFGCSWRASGQQRCIPACRPGQQLDISFVLVSVLVIVHTSSAIQAGTGVRTAERLLSISSVNTPCAHAVTGTSNHR